MARDDRWLGYPGDYIADVKKTYRSLILWNTLCGTLTLVFTLGYVFDWSWGLFYYAPAIAIYYCFFLLIAWSPMKGLRNPKIVPYFKKGKEPPEGSTWASGNAFARNCRYLDEIASEHGFEPLSMFGFADDNFAPSPIQWFDAERGLKTVSFLIVFLHENPEAVPETETVISDLSKIEFRLKDASSRNIDFRFILRYSDGWSVGEQNMRRGTYF